MNKESFWIFTHLGLGDMIVCNALFRHYAELLKDKLVILPIWEHNLAAIQWLLSDVPNIFFYPIETEHELINCMKGFPNNTSRTDKNDCLRLGFYAPTVNNSFVSDVKTGWCELERKEFFNPILWDSEFYRQAGLDTELKWKGFKLPEFDKSYEEYVNSGRPCIVSHQDKERGFGFREEIIGVRINQNWALKDSCRLLHLATEIHCIDSSMLNLADLMETPYCKRFVFHRYARKGLPPQLRKAWEIID